MSELETERRLDQVRLSELEAERKLDRARVSDLEAERELELELGSRRLGGRATETLHRARIEELEDKVRQGEAGAVELDAERRQDRTRIQELESCAGARPGRGAGERGRDRGPRGPPRGGRVTDQIGRGGPAGGGRGGPAPEVDAPSACQPSPSSPGSRPRRNSVPPSTGGIRSCRHPEELGPAGTGGIRSRRPGGGSGPAHHGQAAGGVSWQPTAKRTLSASLARESVWRNVLKETVQVLGSEGGWDTVTAWLPDETNNLGCAATWTAHRGLDRFESLTWEVPVKREGSLLDQALQAPHLTWLTDIDTVDDARLQTAAAHGMNSALLLPGAERHQHDRAARAAHPRQRRARRDRSRCRSRPPPFSSGGSGIC